MKPFEGRQYAPPFPLVGRQVQMRGVPGRVLIIANGQVVHANPRHTDARLFIEQDCYEPDGAPVCAARAALYGATGRPGSREKLPIVVAPTPLGRLGRAVRRREELGEAAARPLGAYKARVRTS